MVEALDITFDVRTDSSGKDPDSASRTLRQYHKLLWSKKLPSGHAFFLDDTVDEIYLHHNSDLGEFFLSSDSIVHTYFKWKRMQHIVTKVPADEMKRFCDLAHTIGGYLIFPGNRINNLPTINQERGINTRINDRIDLTLECVRRFYSGELSPLSATINRYKDFFELLRILETIVGIFCFRI